MTQTEIKEIIKRELESYTDEEIQHAIREMEFGFSSMGQEIAAKYSHIDSTNITPPFVDEIIANSQKWVEKMKPTHEKIVELIHEAKNSGYPVVALLDDGNMAHYQDMQTTEQDGSSPVLRLQKSDVLEYFESGNVDWETFADQYADEILSGMDR